MIGDLRFDPIHFVTDVHAIGNGAFVAVFHDEVLVEKTDGLFGRRSGKTDEMRVEVFEHLPPEVVDGAMALVGDDEIERLDGDGGVVPDRERFGPRVCDPQRCQGRKHIGALLTSRC